MMTILELRDRLDELLDAGTKVETCVAIMIAGNVVQPKLDVYPARYDGELMVIVDLKPT